MPESLPSILCCVVRVGTRVLIDEEKFVVWVRAHGLDAKEINELEAD